MIRKLLAGAIGAGLVFSAAPAFAGEWKLNARACPGLVENHFDRRDDRRDARYDSGRFDRRDSRYDSGRFDRRDDRRNERITICPVSAFYYVPSRGEQLRWRRAGNRGGGDRYSVGRNLRPPLKYDRRARMYFRMDGGRKIYVRL